MKFVAFLWSLQRTGKYKCILSSHDKHSCLDNKMTHKTSCSCYFAISQMLSWLSKKKKKNLKSHSLTYLKRENKRNKQTNKKEMPKKFFRHHKSLLVSHFNENESLSCSPADTDCCFVSLCITESSNCFHSSDLRNWFFWKSC